jgi:hypothetical protein
MSRCWHQSEGGRPRRLPRSVSHPGWSGMGPDSSLLVGASCSAPKPARSLLQPGPNLLIYGERPLTCTIAGLRLRAGLDPPSRDLSEGTTHKRESNANRKMLRRKGIDLRDRTAGSPKSTKSNHLRPKKSASCRIAALYSKLKSTCKDIFSEIWFGAVSLFHGSKRAERLMARSYPAAGASGRAVAGWPGDPRSRRRRSSRRSSAAPCGP